MEEPPPPDEVSVTEVPAEDKGTESEEQEEEDTERCGMDVPEDGLASEDLPSVDERGEGADSLPLVEESGPSSRISSPDLLTPYMRNSPFTVAACKEDGDGEPWRRGTFSVSVVDEVGAGQQGEGSEGDAIAIASVTHTELMEGDQSSDRDEQALKVRMYIHILYVTNVHVHVYLCMYVHMYE